MSYASVTSSAVASPQISSYIKEESSLHSLKAVIHFASVVCRAFLVSCQAMETAGFTTHITFWCLQDTMKENVVQFILPC